MTESEWLSCSDPQNLLKFLQKGRSYRKLNLFAIACCRRASDLMNDPRHSLAFAAAEFMAEGPHSAGDSAECADPFQSVVEMWAEEKKRLRRFGQKWRTSHYLSLALLRLRSPYASEHVAKYIAKALASRGANICDSVLNTEMTIQCGYIRDIFGNPFHRISLSQLNLSPNAIMLAEHIYERRAFELLPIIGDALEESGCTDLSILSHCRDPLEHVRGCWVVDDLLGRE